jgi:hypothetical protein
LDVLDGTVVLSSDEATAGVDVDIVETRNECRSRFDNDVVAIDTWAMSDEVQYETKRFIGGCCLLSI